MGKNKTDAPDGSLEGIRIARRPLPSLVPPNPNASAGRAPFEQRDVVEVRPTRVVPPA
jgi:hypothetical protein